MKIHRSLDSFSTENTVLTIGTFDGVHQGHNKLIGTLKKRAKETGGESVVMTFWPHPRLVLRPDDLSISLLCTLEERIEMLSHTGIDHLVIFPFTREFSQLGSCEFIEQVLVKQLSVKHLVVGYDHAFGRNREGNYENLKACAVNFGFAIERVEALNVDAINVSSTKIRTALTEGKIAKANLYLNHPYSLTGKVVVGQKLGRKLGFPTLNLEVERFKLVPKDGVYAVRVIFHEKEYEGMLNIGIRPTIEDPRNTKTIEVHLFDFNQSIYGEQVQVYFEKRIRSEKKFDSVDILRKQLQVDMLSAKQILKEKAKL